MKRQGARCIFISVAEDSADMHAAALIERARERLPGCSFYGLTGPRMRAAGAETLFDLTAHAAMLTGVLKVAARGWRAIRTVTRAWQDRKPDLAILIDSPELHLPLARRARRLGIPVLYYIAPQTWASRAGRNQRIARDVDRLACILPFEQAYFRNAGVQAEFVGHPLFETLRSERSHPQRVAALRSGEGPLIAILPGSRRHVIRSMLPLQLEVLRKLARANKRSNAPSNPRSNTRPNARFRTAISAVDDERAALVRELIAGFPLPTETVVADNASLLSAADLVLVTSGTATLHVAHYRKPMIVMYDAGRLLRLPYRLFGRMVVKTPHLSLVNILADKRVVPEFMPFVPDAGAVARTAGQLLADGAWRELMIAQIDEVVRPLEERCASDRVCDLIATLLEGRSESRDRPARSVAIIR